MLFVSLVAGGPDALENVDTDARTVRLDLDVSALLNVRKEAGAFLYRRNLHEIRIDPREAHTKLEVCNERERLAGWFVRPDERSVLAAPDEIADYSPRALFSLDPVGLSFYPEGICVSFVFDENQESLTTYTIEWSELERLHAFDCATATDRHRRGRGLE